MAELTPVIKDSFLQFAGAVLQSRALPDVRDCMKPSARQIFYCLYTDKFVHSKPFQKTLKAIGSAFRMYIHGDSSAEGIIMRAGQPFSMRYPLVEVEGSYGTLIASGSWAATRYTASRLSSLAEYLFADIDKEVIEEWRWNYDDTEQYPMVLPSKGFFNLVNGAYGIGVGASASIPQYNLRELNEALIKLLWNPEISFDEIYCVPDFATGAILLNADDVKESHRKGNGFACKLRSVVEYSSGERCFTVTEIPYMTYTETICKELETLIESEENPGIERFNDLTGETPLIKIYLAKSANPDRVLKYLYKNTSLQSHYGVNFTMLENGRYPRVFTWKEILQAHINHEINIYINGYNYDLKKINARLHIIDGLLKAIDMIDEVIKTIKQSSDTKSASIALQTLLNIDEKQVKAILDIKLSRLAHLEVTKLKNEQTTLIEEKTHIEAILTNEELLKKEIEKGFRVVADKFGDTRRTKILNISTNDEEPIERKNLQFSLTNKNNLFISEVSSLYTQNRNSVGAKLKLDNGEYIYTTALCESIDTVMFFSRFGNMYSRGASTFPINEKIYLNGYFNLSDRDAILTVASFNKSTHKNNIIFITKNGIIKKTELSEYNTSRSSGVKAIELNSGDLISNVLICNEENIGIATEFGQLLICQTKDVRPLGRTAKGIKGIKLNSDDSVISAHIIPTNVKEFITISTNGYAKRFCAADLPTQGRNTKGAKVLREKEEDDLLADFLPIETEKEVIVASTSARVKIRIDDLPSQAKSTIGVKTMKLSNKDSVIALVKI